MSEEVIELSINETQALRAKLGLPPLRGVPNSGSGSTSQSATPHIDNNTAATTNTNDEELVLSINETNALRAKIGLPPLKTNNSSDSNKAAGSSQSTAIHIVPTNTSADKEAKQRIEDATAKRLNANSIAALEKENSKFESKEEESALDFATKMLQSKNSTKDGDNNKESGNKDDKQKKKKKRKKKLTSNPQLSLGDNEEEDNEQQYTAADLQGIKVSHSTSDFIAGSTTVLTLADKSILDINPSTQKASMNNNTEDDNELINANIDHDTQALANLKRKRQIELGAGRAGGYAGYDDDEFEELGGVGIANNGNGLGIGGGVGGGSGGGKSGRGFAIGANGKAIDSSTKDESKSDIFTSGAINLQSRNPSKVASDFMTHDDNNDTDMNVESREEKLEKERKKQQKILEKLRKKDSKKAKKAAKKKKKRRKAGGDESSDDEEATEGGGGGSSSLLANLEATAVGNNNLDRKRRRQDDGEDATMDDKDNTSDVEKEDDMIEKRKRFDKIMEKGKARTDKAFNSSKLLVPSKSMAGHDSDDGDDDDAFLNAALAKARRLKRLKELSGGGGGNASGGGGTVKREDAVVQAVAKLKQEEETKAKSEGTGSGEAGEKGGITFEFDEMQEFTRALRAREDQAKRTGKDGKGERSRRGVKATIPGSKDTTSKGTVKDESTVAVDTSMSKAQEDQVKVEDVDMEELAQGMEEEDNEEDETSGAFGTTAESAPIGRGMSNFLSMLNQTGEIKKHATKEEMRGRAKDKRTYEDYEQLDLHKVVNVDTNNAHEKDVELANREIKLEYRDDFGRLLTRKEAYRNMCYQFHGHGSSKKNQERRLKQIEREREEASMASRGGVGTLGSLKATQKATGKAFVVHKT